MGSIDLPSEKRRAEAGVTERGALGRFASSAKRFVRGRWTAVSISFCVLLFSGATYIFGIYSGAIKSALRYDQSTIDTLSFFKDLGGNVGIVAGLMSEVAPPWLVLVAGAALNFGGYFMMWASATGRVAEPPVGAMYLYMYVAANSQTFVHTAVLVSCVKNFPAQRGAVLGLTKGCIGLSGAVLTQLFRALYGGQIASAADSTGLILLIAWLPSAIVLLFMRFVRLMPAPIASSYGDLDAVDGREKQRFFSYLYLALALAGFLMAAIVLESVLRLPALAYGFAACLTLLLVGSNVLVAVRAECGTAAAADAISKAPAVPDCESNLPAKPDTKRGVNAAKAPFADDKIGHGSTTPCSNNAPCPNDAPCSNNAPCPNDAPASKEEQGGGGGGGGGGEVVEAACPSSSNSSSAGCWGALAARARAVHTYFFAEGWPERGSDFTIAQALVSLDFWILLASVTCGVGAALAAIDNMGQIGESLGYPALGVSTCVSLISIWNFLGRVASGFGSDYVLRRYRISRSLVLALVLAASCVGHILIAFPLGPGTLYLASALVGFCFGALWPPLYAVLSEIFGLKYFATIYNVVGVASPLGSYLFNVKVAGYFYDREARRQSDGSDPLVCTGVHCFRLTFVIMAIVCAAGCALSSLLVVRTSKFYSQDIFTDVKYRAKKPGQQEQCPSSMPLLTPTAPPTHIVTPECV